MAVIHGKNGTVTWAGTSQANLTGWTLTMTADTADDTEMGDAWQSFKVGFADWSATIEINVDTTGILLGTAAVLGELGSAAQVTLTDGTATYTGTAIAEAFEVSESIDDVVKCTYTLAGTGGILAS